VAIERHRELRRRRSRTRKINIFARRAKTANTSEKAVLAAKIRKLTPGAEEIIARLGLAER
jgi:hypothetical protein